MKRPSEFELIERLTRGLVQPPAVLAGPGDDCAVLDLGLAERVFLFKTDAVVEGVHFTREIAPERVGRKALARCLSDIAAMAGTPQAALVTLGLPRDYDLAYVEGIYAGLTRLAEQHAVAIVGGETTTNPERIFLSLALLGWAGRERVCRRAGARPGDALFVTGELGGSLEGKHLDFEPRLAEARWLAAQFPIHAMMDVSDGLAGDLRHLLQAGGVGAELLAAAIPISPAARRRAREKTPARPPLAAALSDGEDFELLFTAPAAQAVPLLDAWKIQFPGIRLSCIGKITETPGLRVRDRQGVRVLSDHGYTHFT